MREGESRRAGRSPSTSPPVPPRRCAPAVAGAPIAGILRTQEGRYEDGRWIGGRWLNGDQTHGGRHVRLEPQEFSMQRVH